MKTTTKSGKNKGLILGLALLVGGGIYAMNQNKKTDETPPIIPPAKDPTPVNTGNGIVKPSKPPVKPMLANPNLLLKVGIKAATEVKALQQLMGITADGIFGQQTENKLYQLKGVKQITLTDYAKVAPKPIVLYPKGTKVMAEARAGATTYWSETKADGSFVKSTSVFNSVPYGKSIGVVRGSSADKIWYIVEYPVALGSKMIFVKVVDVKNY